ncbi:MAG TPA: hypothetical protein VFX96_16550 [Pyrinomonadaceae bacterium]|nr:hypothetical protein [Pyrinomonadaceae bacterium]
MKLARALNACLTAAVLTAVAAVAAVAAQDETPAFQMPAIAEAADAAQGFVPSGWRLLGSAEGDLNADGRADLALALAHDAEQSDPGDIWQEPRLLVIALREANGKLRRSAVSQEAVMCRGCGGVFGDPFADMRIERGALVVDHYGGSRDRWSFVDRFRYDGGRWVHIGATERHMDSFEPDFEESRDANLSTGLVIESASGRPRGNYRRVFYELRAGRVERAPALDGRIAPDEWPGTTVKLEAKEQVVEGAASWRGAADASARLGAVYAGGELYVRAEVSDDSVGPGDALALVTKSGQIVKPLEMKTAPAPGGYIVEALYATKALGIDEIEARIKEMMGHGAPASDLPADRVLRVAVELVDTDAGQKVTSVLSTSRGGRKYPAAIRLTPHHGPPLLSNFDREASMDVMGDH